MDDDTDNGDLWVSISELARLKNVDKAAISRRVAKLEAEGVIETRAGERNEKLVFLPQYDRATDQAATTLRMLDAEGDRPPAGGSSPYAKARAAREAYSAAILKLELDERRKALLPVKDVEAAMVRVAEQMLRTIDRFVSEHDNPLIRPHLKETAAQLRQVIADEMRLTADSEDAEDEVA